MRKVLLSIWFLLVAAQVSAQGGGALVTIPGSGVKILPPTGLSLAKAGPTLMDESGETIVTFMMTDISRRPDNDSTWRALYSRDPEKLHVAAQSANLYQRTRLRDGGAWDGWLLSLARGNKVLVVMTTYTGGSKENFARIRDHLQTIVWDESVTDSEQSLGVRLVPRGLKRVTIGFGSLLFNKTGVAGAGGPELMVQAVPIPSVKIEAMFKAGCQPLLASAFSGQEFVGAIAKKLGPFDYCEGWKIDSKAGLRYAAMIRLANGALISAFGTAPESEASESLPIFRDAVSTLKVIEGRASSRP